MRTVNRDTGCIQFRWREDHLQEEKNWERIGEKWEERPSFGRRRINVSSYAYQLNWENTQGDVPYIFLLWGLNRSQCFLIPFWPNFAAARWGKEGVNDIGCISVLRVTWKSSGFAMPGGEGNSTALFVEISCFSDCPLLCCKYSSFHFPKLGPVPEECIWIAFAHYPPQKRISQQGPYS